MIVGRIVPFLDPHLGKRERIFWLLVYFFSVVLSFSVCCQLVINYVNSPIVVSVEKVDDGLTGEVFPTVTVCNIRKWLARGTTGDEFHDKLRFIKTRIRTAMRHCSWKSQTYYCDELFEPVLTDWETFCYSFNYGFPERHTWFNNSSRASSSSSGVELRAVAGVGVNNGLSFILDIIKKQNGDIERYDLISTRRESLGFMVLVHPPDEFPILSGGPMHIAPGLENNFKVELSKVFTTDNVRSHPAARLRKNCYFPHERRLLYFGTYSNSACRIECIINITLEKCGCRHWTAPGSPSDPLCFSDNDTICHMKVADGMQKKSRPEFVEQWKRCNCRSRCRYPLYQITSSYAILDANSVATRFNTTVEYARYNILVCNVFFGSHQTTLYSRDVLSTFSNLCSNIGGILGAILGWSLISLVRLVWSVVQHIRSTNSVRPTVVVVPPPPTTTVTRKCVADT